MLSNTLNQTTRAKLDQGLGRFILNQFVDFWPYYLGALVSLYFTHWIQSYLPFLAKELAEKVTESIDEISLMQFAWLALGIIIFRTASRLLFFYPARILQRNIRVELVEKIEKNSPLRYSSYSPGQIFQILGNDMEQIRALVGFALLQVGNIIIAMIVLLPKLFEFNPSLVVALLPMFIAFCLFSTIVAQNRYYYRKTQDAQGEVQNFIMESYIGKKTIKNYHAEKPFIKLFDDFSWQELWYFYRAGIGVSFSIPLVPLGVGLSLLWGSHIIFQQDLGTSSIILFSGFIFLFLEPLMFLSWIGIVFTRSIGSWNRIEELVSCLDKKSSHEEYLEKNNNESFFNSDPPAMNFHVDFWNQKMKVVIQNNLWTALVGSTGCGKSEVLKQISEILKQKEQKLSYVSQEPYLYNDTIQGNIFLGKEVSSDRLKLAGKLLVLFGLDVLESTPEKLLALNVGENGKRLSGGQAKRLCLVRSLMDGAATLVWDDPFSSVDVILERKIMDDLRSMAVLEEKTVIMTTHRYSTARYCDNLIYLDRDQGLVEFGPREKLLETGTKTYEHFKDQMV